MPHDRLDRPRTAKFASLRLNRFLRGMIFGSAACCIIGTAAAQTSGHAQPPQQTGTNSPAPPGKGATPAIVLDDKDVEPVLGKEIYSEKGEDMGKVVDVLVDHSGQVRAAIIDFGGFLGVGSRNIAVDWQSIHFSPDGKPKDIVLSLTRDQVRVAPEYKQGEPIVVLGSSSVSTPASRPAGGAAPANSSSSR